jgi:hypothetical protein
MPTRTRPTPTTPDQPKLRRRQWLASLFLAATTVTASFTAGTPAQAAAGDPSYVLGGTFLRTCGYTTAVWCGSFHSGIIGTTVGNQWPPTYCWRDGGWAGGTNRWFRVRVNTDVGVRTGYVSASQVPIQALVPHCPGW